MQGQKRWLSIDEVAEYLGANITHRDGLLKKAPASFEHTFQRRAAKSLLGSREALLPTATDKLTSDGGDFNLLTWLVILEGLKP